MPSRIAVVLFLAVLTGLPGLARADKIDDLSNQLRGSSSYKVRLSAALTLTKLRDERAIEPLIRALRDSEKSVRGVAAAGLAKLVKKKTKSKVKKKVLAALKRAMENDKNDFVRRQAEKAYSRVGAVSTQTSSARAGGMFVDLGAMGDKTGKNEALRKLMRKTVQKTFGKKADDIAMGVKPSARVLRKMSAFHIDGTLTSVEVKKRGSSAEVSCKVSMLMASFPKKSMFGFLDGGARVQTGSSKRDIQYGKEDCVAAVVEDLIARKVIPTLRGRVK